MRADSKSLLLPLDIHFHENSVDPLILWGERDHADFFVAVLEQKVFIVRAEIQVVYFMFEVEQGVGWAVGLAVEVNVYLVDGFLRADFYADC